MFEKKNNPLFLKISGLFLLFFVFPIVAEPESSESLVDVVNKDARLPDELPENPGIEAVVHFVLRNNNQARLQQLEIAKADTDEKKLDSLYSPKVYFDATSYVKKDPERFSNFLMGDTVTNDSIAVGYSQLLPTGTYVSLEASQTRYDTNAGESPLGYIAMGELAYFLQQPAIHTGALTLTLSQELLKDGFGYNQQRMREMARNGSRMQREELTYQLSQLVVKAMVDYWSLAVQDENLETRLLLKKSIESIRNITYRKMTFGLAEKFQLNQWNAMLAQAEINVDDAKNKRDETERAFLRIMNLPEERKITTVPVLLTSIPGEINLDADLDHAVSTRPDIKNVMIQMENVKLNLEMAQNSMLPSVTLNGKVSSRDQATRSAMSYNAVPSVKYPEASIQLRVEYPLWDEGSEVDLRNAELSLRQLEIQKEEMIRQVRDDLKNAYDDVYTAHRSLEKASYAVSQTESFYNNILVGYRQGRFQAETLKDALDALFQARFGYLQAKIGFNIALVSYDMKSNRMWDKYNVNIDEHIDRMVVSK